MAWRQTQLHRFTMSGVRQYSLKDAEVSLPPAGQVAQGTPGPRVFNTWNHYGEEVFEDAQFGCQLAELRTISLTRRAYTVDETLTQDAVTLGPHLLNEGQDRWAKRGAAGPIVEGGQWKEQYHRPVGRSDK
eukprot:Platyproteum_vivax@DN12127_c0_g1_i1.p2